MHTVRRRIFFKKHLHKTQECGIIVDAKRTFKKGGVFMEKKESKKIIAQNKKAYHDYFVEDTYEAGVELFGTEVKSIRNGSVNLKDSFCTVRKGELFALGVRISPYEKGNIFNRDPLREKRLLMHKREIIRLSSFSARDGYSLVPLSLYFRGSRVKLEIGLCKGKKLYDKREADAERSAKREMEQYSKTKNRAGEY